MLLDWSVPKTYWTVISAACSYWHVNRRAFFATFPSSRWGLFICLQREKRFHTEQRGVVLVFCRVGRNIKGLEETHRTRHVFGSASERCTVGNKSISLTTVRASWEETTQGCRQLDPRGTDTWWCGPLTAEVRGRRWRTVWPGSGSNSCSDQNKSHSSHLELSMVSVPSQLKLHLRAAEPIRGRGRQNRPEYGKLPQTEPGDRIL